MLNWALITITRLLFSQSGLGGWDHIRHSVQWRPNTHWTDAEGRLPRILQQSELWLFIEEVLWKLLIEEQKINVVQIIIQQSYIVDSCWSILIFFVCVVRGLIWLQNFLFFFSCSHECLWISSGVWYVCLDQSSSCRCLSGHQENGGRSCPHVLHPVQRRQRIVWNSKIFTQIPKCIQVKRGWGETKNRVEQ